MYLSLPNKAIFDWSYLCFGFYQFLTPFAVVVFLLPLSREDIANVVGTATELCIRVISQFKKKGLLKTSGKKVGIANEKGLREVAEGF